MTKKNNKKKIKFKTHEINKLKNKLCKQTLVIDFVFYAITMNSN